MCAIASTRNSFLGAAGMPASIAKQRCTICGCRQEGKNTDRQDILAPWRSAGNCAFSLLLDWSLGPRLRLGFRLATIRLRLLGLAPRSCLCLRNEQHLRAAVEMHVLPRRSNQRSLRAVGGR